MGFSNEGRVVSWYKFEESVAFQLAKECYEKNGSIHLTCQMRY